ncbi:GTPase domain-containing protein [Pseudomonas aeruginosa]|nr:GTPase domain-containing protein [Pseudomonas aeruginosa]
MEKTGINIAVLGKTGVGKSSFCNYIFDEDVFATGTGSPVTGWEEHFKSHSIEHQSFTLNIFDSVGIEPDNYEKWRNLLDRFLLENGPHGNGTPMQWLHAAIYLINAASARVEEVELSLLSSLAQQQVPTHIVLTNCDSASPEQISGIKHTILNQLKNASITEVCSVAVRKRSGTSERYGKADTIDCFLGKLDTELRRHLISYACDKQAVVIRQARKYMVEKIDDSQIGLFNIIKGVVQDGDNFDIDQLFDIDFDLDAATEEYQKTLDDLDCFLMDLGFVSNSDSTLDVLGLINEQVSDDMDAVGSKIEEKLNEVTNAFDGDSFWEKTKAVARIGAIVIDIKGFMIRTLDEVFDSALTSIEKHKLIHTNA